MLSGSGGAVSLCGPFSLPLAGFFPFSFSFFSFLERSPAPGVWNQLDKLLSYGGGRGGSGRRGEGRGGRGGGAAAGGGGATGPGRGGGAGACAPPGGDPPRLWANLIRRADAGGREGGGSGRPGAGVSHAADPASSPAWRNEPGFRAAINEARGGRRGLHGLGGRGLPRRARHSFPLNWAPGPAPPPRPARIALGERRPARGWGVAGHGRARSKARGGPLSPLRCSPGAPESSAAREGRDRFTRLRGGEPEPGGGRHRLAGVSGPHSPFLCPRPETFHSPRL